MWYVFDWIAAGEGPSWRGRWIVQRDYWIHRPGFDVGYVASEVHGFGESICSFVDYAEAAEMALILRGNDSAWLGMEEPEDELSSYIRSRR